MSMLTVDMGHSHIKTHRPKKIYKFGLLWNSPFQYPSYAGDGDTPGHVDNLPVVRLLQFEHHSSQRQVHLPTHSRGDFATLWPAMNQNLDRQIDGATPVHSLCTECRSHRCFLYIGSATSFHSKLMTGISRSIAQCLSHSATLCHLQNASTCLSPFTSPSKFSTKTNLEHMGALKLNKMDICSRSARLHHSFHAKEVSQSWRHACTTHDLPVKEAVLGSKAKLLTRREALGQFAARAPTHNEYHILWIAAKSV
jgi:hypothetical protein